METNLRLETYWCFVYMLVYQTVIAVLFIILFVVINLEVIKYGTLLSEEGWLLTGGVVSPV